MQIRQRGTLKKFEPKPGTPNQEPYTVIQVVVPTALLTDAGQVADGYRYVGHTVELILRADPLPMPLTAERPMERLWSSNGPGEHARPGPTETCSECGKVIGDDPDADFYAPLAGPSRPVCGDCAVKLDDRALAEEEEGDEEGETDDDARDRAADQLAAAEPGDLEPDEPADAPIGDGPTPERPEELEPVTAPTRRRR